MNKKLQSGFTLIELIVVMAIIGVLAAITAGSFNSSQMRGRDSRRKSDLSQVTKALETYYNDRGVYPDDNGGQIVGCGTTALPTDCPWGQPFQQLATGATADTIYMVTLPSDPRAPSLAYYYEAAGNQRSYQIYARLENTEDTNVPKDGSGNPQIYNGLTCGNDPCNFGVSSSNITPATNRTLVTE